MWYLQWNRCLGITGTWQMLLLGCPPPSAVSLKVTFILWFFCKRSWVDKRSLCPDSSGYKPWSSRWFHLRWLLHPLQAAAKAALVPRWVTAKESPFYQGSVIFLRAKWENALPCGWKSLLWERQKAVCSEGVAGVSGTFSSLRGSKTMEEPILKNYVLCTVQQKVQYTDCRWTGAWAVWLLMWLMTFNCFWIFRSHRV